MDIYFLTRWGNGEDEDGPDSSNDTHIIVRAKDLKRASEVADPLLLRLPTKSKNGREVSTFTHHAALIGKTNIQDETEGVIAWPWYSFNPPQNCTKIWIRDSLDEGWITHEEYYGEPPTITAK